MFHLHNTSATHELSVYLDGQRLRHECHLTYLGVTLDRTLSYREHLTKTAGNLKNRNNMLMKLAGSTWGAGARPLSRAAATFLAGANQIWLARRRADQNSAGGGGRLFRRRRNSARPRERRHIALLVSLSMEHVVSTASVVTVGYFGAH